MKKVFLFMFFIGTFCFLPQKGWSQVLQSCDQWANTTVNGYNVYNNIWGSGAGSQCITVYSEADWYVDASHTGGGIKSYPNAERQLSVNVDDMEAITSTFSVTRPSGGAYSSTYDIWYENYAYEIMLWMNYTGDLGPISYNYGCSGYPSTACPVVTNVSVGGHTWNVYQGNNGGNEVFSFIRTSNTNSGTVDITAISQWLRGNGWFGNVNLHSIQFGFEITSTSGTQRYEIDDFSVSIGSGGSSTYYQLQNRATGLFLDGMGRTSNGSACGQWANTTSYNSNWELISQGGSYYQLRNRTTGMYLDGMGSTTNGSDCGQWASTTSYNSHWELLLYTGSYYRLRNRSSGLYLDGMGLTSNGANCGQWANTTHNNAQWLLVDASSSRTTQNLQQSTEDIASITSSTLAYPNPAHEKLTIRVSNNEQSATATIYNLLGQQLLNQHITSTDNQLNISDLSQGIYLLEVTTSSGTIREKVIKQ